MNSPGEENVPEPEEAGGAAEDPAAGLVTVQRPSSTLRGTPVSPGLSLAPIHRRDFQLEEVHARRIPLEQIELELNRFQDAIAESHRQLAELRERLSGHVPEEQVRILDTHAAYLKDSVFLSDVENLIVGEQIALEAAIAKVIFDFDRIFQLVENEALQERAVDLRDVGLRVLRNLDVQVREEPSEDQPEPDYGAGRYVLVASELRIVDLFSVDLERLAGIVTEEGSITSHAAILARSLRIPTLTGIKGLLDDAREGDFAILEATEGMLRLRPDSQVREQFEAALESMPESGGGGSSDWWGTVRCEGGLELEVLASCGNLPEVVRAHESGMRRVGLYRTELLYHLDREQPSLDSLTAHYQAVSQQAGDEPVTFRLLDVDSDTPLAYLHEERESNPGLGSVGIRALLTHDDVLRRQLRAILGATDGQARIAVPKVIDCGELRRVREILFEERYAASRAGVQLTEDVAVGVVIETPAAVFGAAELAKEADFLLVGLDSLQQYVLAADRDEPHLSSYFDTLHPILVRVLRRIVDAASAEEREVSVFGVSAALPGNLPLLVGAGLSRFSISPVAVDGFVRAASSLSLKEAERAADCAHRYGTRVELQNALQGYGH